MAFETHERAAASSLGLCAPRGALINDPPKENKLAERAAILAGPPPPPPSEYFIQNGLHH
jgi:hypothetical protein